VRAALREGAGQLRDTGDGDESRPAGPGRRWRAGADETPCRPPGSPL